MNSYMPTDFAALRSNYRDVFRNKNLDTLATFQANVVLAYRLLERQKAFPQRTENETQSFAIDFGFDRIDDNVKAGFRKWIVIAGFDELFRWIKELLIDYIMYVVKESGPIVRVC